MAKKQTLNMFEAHLEKIALAASLSVCLAVILIRFIVGSGVDNKSASQATSEAARRAQTIVGNMKTPGNPADPYKPAAKEMVDVKALALQEIDRRPIDPPWIEGELLLAPPTDMEIPAIPLLKQVVADLTHTQAEVPDDQTNTNSVADVDFITVEAVFAIEQLRQAYRRCFGDSRNPKNPVKYPGPIAGVLDLQRGLLLPDGDWGPWRSVMGLKNDILSNKVKLLTLKMSDLSTEEYEVMLSVQQTLESQSQVLRPPAYTLTGNRQWLIPSESRKLKAEQTGGGRRTARRTTTTGLDPTTQSRFNPAGLPAAGRGGATASAALPGEPEDWLDQEEIRIWAHDGEVEPGGIYRYRIRIGFFNPVAGKNWIKPEQQQYRNEIMLWSDWIAPRKFSLAAAPEEPEQDNRPEEFVKVPERVLFFPKTSGAGALQTKTVNVEVYRWQNGTWYSKSFTISPGSVIGDIVAPSEAQDAGLPPLIDFRTGATLIDIIPDRIYHFTSGRTLKDGTTVDLVYRDADGLKKWMGQHQSSWPESLKEKRTEILDTNPVPIR